MIIPLLLATTLFDVNLVGARDQVVWNSKRGEKIEAMITDACERKRIPGCVGMVALNGKVVFQIAKGYADIEKQTAIRTDTIFQVMSMTKPVTAAAVMLLVEDGKLGLDDPIERYLPNFRGIQVRLDDGKLVPPKRVPTIRDCLTHTSGLSGNDPGGMDDDTKRKMTLAQYAAKLGAEPLTSQPGTRIQYSGVGFSALAAIVEIVSGVKFEDFVQRRIFEPLKMEDAYFFLPESKQQRLAKTYTGEQGKLTPWPEDPMRPGAKFANGAGGIYATADAMAKFLDAFVRPGSAKGFLSVAGIRLMTSLQTGDLPMDGKQARGFGLGWSVVSGPEGETTLRQIGSFGHTGAFGTEFWGDSRIGVGVVFLAQTLLIPEDTRKSFTTMINAALDTKSR